MARAYMTQAGYDKLRAELDDMEHIELPAILERLEKARSEGDLRENAEYHGARESQALLEAKMSDLRYKLSQAEIVDENAFPSDEVAFGCTVKVENMNFGRTETFMLVGEGEEDAMNGRILLTSPLAIGLSGKKVGEIAEVQVPIGILKLKVLEITRD